MKEKRENDLKNHIKEILEEDGMARQTAKNIAFGTQPMNNLERALKLSKYPHFISPFVWDYIYKGSNRVEKKK